MPFSIGRILKLKNKYIENIIQLPVIVSEIKSCYIERGKKNPIHCGTWFVFFAEILILYSTCGKKVTLATRVLPANKGSPLPTLHFVVPSTGHKNKKCEGSKNHFGVNNEVISELGMTTMSFAYRPLCSAMCPIRGSYIM